MTEESSAARPVYIDLTEEELTLVATALRSESSRRQRAATRASNELMREIAAGTVTDKRPGSVKIVGVLHEAAALEDVAGKLEDAFANPPTDKPADPAAVPKRVSDRVATLLGKRPVPGGSEADDLSEVVQDDDVEIPEVPDPDAEDANVDVLALGMTDEERAEIEAAKAELAQVPADA